MENKKTRGRQKIPMKKIENEDDRYATFTKRRIGIYKKASELCTLCNIDIGVVIFSPTGKPFSFFHPSMNLIIHRFFNRSPHSIESTRLVDAHTRARIDQLNPKLDELSARAEAETERGKKLDQMDEARDDKAWWKKPIEDYNKEEVEKMTALLKNLKIQISRRREELKNGASSSLSFPQENLSVIPYGTTLPDIPSGPLEANNDSSSSAFAQQNVMNTFYANSDGTIGANIGSSSSGFPPTDELLNLYPGGTTETNIPDGTTEVINAPSSSSFVPQSMINVPYEYYGAIDGDGGWSSSALPPTNATDVLYAYPGGTTQTENMVSDLSSFPLANAPNAPYEYYSAILDANNDHQSYSFGDVGLSSSSLPPTNATDILHAFSSGTTQGGIIASASSSFPLADAPNAPYEYYGEILDANNAHQSYWHGNFGLSSSSFPATNETDILNAYPGGTTPVANIASPSSLFPPPNAPNMPYEYNSDILEADNVHPSYRHGNVGSFSSLPPTNAPDMLYAYPGGTPQTTYMASSSPTFRPTDEPYMPYEYNSGTLEADNAHPHWPGNSNFQE